MSEQSLHVALGLLDEEYEEIKNILGRTPNHLELALFAVMWSEHCSYKSSRIHLRRLPTTAPYVLVGPGENAGVIDAGDGIALAIRIESHNHPSAIEPHQGAATGVGGILRDIFTMGARPLAVMDPLFFGPPDDARQRWLVEGVVGGVAAYGNSVGVPTVGGELTFDPCYTGNPLVNVLCLGALPTERLVLGQASGPGNLVVLLGATTGRDGIGGVSVLASAGFDEGADESKRPSVQVGDPFEEKRLIEACLALLDEGLVVGIQDLGGAGLACATSETAARGRVGMDVDINAIATREPGMEPFEIMTSESQERMLAIITPANWEKVAALCERHEVRAKVIGKVVEPEVVNGEQIGRLRIMDGFDGDVLASVPAAALADDAPLYNRPLAPPNNREELRKDDPDTTPAGDIREDLLSMMMDSSWVWRQYDHQLLLNTVVGPGADAALLRLAGPGLPPSDRGIALTTDSAPRWSAVDPRQGVALVLAESMANLACVGGRAKAVVNCLNFGNPTHPEVMWQLSETVDGLANACEGFSLPVIGGNVSLYNETAGVDIDPTPVIGLLGLTGPLKARPPGLGWHRGDGIVLVGEYAAKAHLGGSRWARLHGRRGGVLPALDMAAHVRVVDYVATLIEEALQGKSDLVHGVHDVSGGGLLSALCEMAVASSLGATFALLGSTNLSSHAQLFFEGPSRFVLSSHDPGALVARAHDAGVGAIEIGFVSGDSVVIPDVVEIPLSTLTQRWSRWLPDHIER
jgi:phosphoribosylformylglycinamidine synthase